MPERQLLLVRGRSYKHRGQIFFAGKPKEVRHEKHYQDLLHTGLFAEFPPSSLVLIEYQGTKLQKTFRTPFGKITMSRNKPIRVQPWVANHLKGEEISVVGNKELLDYLKKKESFRALYLRDMGLGDVLIFNSCLRDFRQQFPGAKITAATREEYRFVLREVADEVQTITDTYDAEQYDISANLCRKSEEVPISHVMDRADIYAMHMGFQMQEYRMQFSLPEGIQEEVPKLLRKHGWNRKKPLVALQLYGSPRQRTWPKNNFVELAALLKKSGKEPIFLHQQKETEWDGRGINLTGATDVPTFCGIIEKCPVVLSSDSSGYHVKEALGNGHAFAIFSTVLPDLRIRHYKRTTALWEGYEQKMVCGGPCFDAGCKPLHCFRFWTPEKVCQLILEQFEKGVS